MNVYLGIDWSQLKHDLCWMNEAGADVAVFKLHSGQSSFSDCGRAKLTGDKKLECALTVRDGKIVYNIGGLASPEWTQAPAPYWVNPALQDAARRSTFNNRS